MRNSIAYSIVLALILQACGSSTHGGDFFLTIGGGDEPSYNQASLENNVLFFQRVLEEHRLDHLPHDIFFADGHASEKDLQVKDPESVPKANRLMAEFFGTQDDLGLYYRNHAVPNVRAAATPQQIRLWFNEVGSQMKSGDRLILYVTAHGEASDDDDKPYNTSVSLWHTEKITVSQVVSLLDQLPNGVRVVAVMVQCHAGGFARFIYDGGNPHKGLSKQRRIGFFATMHDRIAAGCTSDIDAASYVEYSTYFWEALGGRTRTGEPIVVPDYDGDGAVSFDEAHGYTLLTANTIDMPIKTSGEFLDVESRFANETHPELLAKNTSYATILTLATPTQKAVLEGLSKQLSLLGDDRLETARRLSQARRWRRGRFRSRRSDRPEVRWRKKIADDLKERWPALANVLNPGSIELMTDRCPEFVQAIEGHPSYDRYRTVLEEAAGRPDPQKQRVKHERFVRTAEGVILHENLRRLGDEKKLAQLRELIEGESEPLSSPSAPDRGAQPADLGEACSG